MSRIVEAPKIDQDAQNQALAAVIETGNLRTKELPRVDAQHAREDKRLLKQAADFLNTLNIFPTVEVIGQHAGSEQKTHTETLLFVTTEKQHGVYKRDYYLNPEGELITYTRVGEQSESKQVASDKEYVLYTNEALFAVEKRIKDAMEARPKLRLL